MAKWFVIIGLVFVVIGLLLYYAPWTLNWFGKLPGDIHIKSENSNVFIPITSMILISIVVTVILNLFKH